MQAYKSFSLWLQPKEPEIQDYLNALVKDLAKKHSGPEFEPHITLLGDFETSFNDLKIKCTQVANATKPFTAQTSSVEYSTTYYQCVFVRIKPSVELMELYDKTKTILGRTNPSMYMPHISLAYGDLSYSQRQAIIDSLTLKPLSFTIDSMTIVPSGEYPPSQWEHLAQLPFQ